jgi:hypothetical protein
MLKKVEAKCKRCGREFYKKRTEQEFCSAQCRNAAWKKPQKRRLKGTPRGSVANGPFSSIKTVACKAPSTSDLGAFVRRQIVAQKDEPNPIGFTLPDGTRARVWLASNGDSKIVGDDRLWRVNIEELLLKQERRPKAVFWTPTAFQSSHLHRSRERASGTRLWLADRHLSVSRQQSACNVATMKREAFKELVAAVRVARPKRRRPSLRLVVSNPTPSIANAVAA